MQFNFFLTPSFPPNSKTVPLARSLHSNTMSEQKRLITAINELDELLSTSPWNYPPEPKNVVESLKTRKEGNDLYVHKKHDDKMHLEIWKLYTRSVAFAPMDSEELGLAYANRSALLAHFKKYIESIEDLERAIRFAVTDFQIVKLMCRKVSNKVLLLAFCSNS